MTEVRDSGLEAEIRLADEDPRGEELRFAVLEAQFRNPGSPDEPEADGGERDERECCDHEQPPLDAPLNASERVPSVPVRRVVLVEPIAGYVIDTSVGESVVAADPIENRCRSDVVSPVVVFVLESGLIDVLLDTCENRRRLRDVVLRRDVREVIEREDVRNDGEDTTPYGVNAYPAITPIVVNVLTNRRPFR